MDILQHVAQFLEAHPKQVQAFDRKFLQHLNHHPATREDFLAGNEVVRWNIYRDIKYTT